MARKLDLASTRGFSQLGRAASLLWDRLTVRLMPLSRAGTHFTMQTSAPHPVSGSAPQLLRAALHGRAPRHEAGIRRLAFLAERLEQLAVGLEDADGVIHVVGAVDSIVGADEDAVRIGEYVLAQMSPGIMRSRKNTTIAAPIRVGIIKSRRLMMY